MLTNEYLFALELRANDGRVLGQHPAEPNWEPRSNGPVRLVAQDLRAGGRRRGGHDHQPVAIAPPASRTRRFR